MDDQQIIELFNARSETAISAVADRYGKYCHSIAYHILHDQRDSEECVNETYLRAWNAIPPQRPDSLSAFLGRITRNLALDRYKHDHRKKRGGGQTAMALDELDECVPSASDTARAVNDQELVDVLNAFLAGLAPKKRQIFVRRYWYLSPISEIARDFAVSESSAKVTLLRTRRELKRFLEKAGIVL